MANKRQQTAKCDERRQKTFDICKFRPPAEASLYFDN